MKNRLAVSFVAATVGAVLMLSAVAAPGQAQEPHDALSHTNVPVNWWGHGFFPHGIGHTLFPEPGFGSIRARVDFDEESRRFRVRVDRVGVDCCFVHLTHPGFLLYSAPYGERPEPWWTGLGLFEEGRPASPPVPPAGRDTSR